MYMCIYFHSVSLELGLQSYASFLKLTFCQKHTVWVHIVGRVKEVQKYLTNKVISCMVFIMSLEVFDRSSELILIKNKANCNTGK